MEPEPAWYDNYRMLILPGPRTREAPFDIYTADSVLETHVQDKPKQLARVLTYVHFERVPN